MESTGALGTTGDEGGSTSFETSGKTTADSPTTNATTNSSSESGGSVCADNADCIEGVCVADRCVPSSPVVVFLNSEGVVLSEGPDGTGDATVDQVPSGYPTGPLPGTNSARASELYEAVQGYFADYPIDVETQRPASGAYMMVVLTASEPPISGVLSLAPADCGNSNPQDVAVLFDSPTQVESTDALARSVAFSIGTMLGVPSVDEPGDLMHAQSGLDSDARAAFLNQCSPWSGIGCEPATCGPSGGGPELSSNSDQALLSALESAG